MSCPTDAASPLRIVRVPLDSLREDPQNARRHGLKNLAAIRDSLREFGQIEPLIVLAATRHVIGGNGRLHAMRSLGWTSADVIEFCGSESQARALAIALNRTAELAEWNEQTLEATLRELRDESFALDRLGFDAADVAELLNESESLLAASSGLATPQQTPLPERFDILVTCRDERHQAALIEKFIAEGLECRALIF